MIAPGSIVLLKGLPTCPQMFVAACDRASAECVWFNAHGDLQRAQFPIWALRQVSSVGRDSGEIAVAG